MTDYEYQQQRAALASARRQLRYVVVASLIWVGVALLALFLLWGGTYD